MKLTVLKNNNQISSFDLDEHSPIDEVYIGRSDDCHVIIDDQSISRHHFVLRKKQNVWYFEKLTKVSKIIIENLEITNTELKDGQKILFSAFTILFEDKRLVAPYVYEEEPKLDLTATPVIKNIEAEEELIENNFDELINEDPLIEDSLVQDGFDNQEDILDTSSESLIEENLNSDELVDNFEETPDEVVSDETFEMIESPQEEIEDEGTRVFNSFVRYQLAIWGEHAPYDRYELDGVELFIGRDPVKCQIVLNDPEVSTVHAIIRRKGNEIQLEDLNSSNGTILNAERINKAYLQTGDEFIIGSTTFSLEIKNDLVDEEKDRLLPVAENQEIELEEEIEEQVDQMDAGEISFDSTVVEEKSIIKRILKNPEKRKKVLIVAVIIFMVYMLNDSEEETTADTDKPKPAVNKEKIVDKKVKKLSPERENARNVAYEIGVGHFEQQNFTDALKEFQTVIDIDDQYKNIQSYFEQTKSALKAIEEAEAKKRADEERIKAKKELEEVIELARQAVKDKKVDLAEGYFAKIIEKDPENLEIQNLKLELDAWKKEQERIALEKAAKEAARKAMVDALSPGKTHYLKKEWYKSINRLEEFLRRKDNDEDLVKEASDMLGDSKEQLNGEIAPILGKARSQKEGQDLRNAYDSYQQVLKIDPTNMEALNEVDDIKINLEGRAKKIYRDAIISESLSLFTEAKEKFQEVQQISPTDSEYYKKASDKLKNYLE